MGNSYANYVKQVGRRLYCSKSERARLLAGLKTELEEMCSKSGNLSLEGIIARFGAPEVVAAELQAALPIEETERYMRRQRWRIRVGVAVGSLVVVLLVAYIAILVNMDVKIIDSEITYHWFY